MVLDCLVNESYEAYDGVEHQDEGGHHCGVGDHDDIGHSIVHYDGVRHPSEVGDHDLSQVWKKASHLLEALACPK